jgi:DNA-binding MarR family transcriptional regulator
MNLTQEEVQEALRQMILLGLVEDSGGRRDGEIMWRLTEKGRDLHYQAQVIQGLKALEKLDALPH